MAPTPKKHRTPIIVLSCALVAVTAALTIILVLYISQLQKNRYRVDKGSVVMTVDGVDIYENQFRFFATLVLEQEDSVYSLLHTEGIDQNLTLKNNVVNFTKEYIFRLREAQAAGITLSEEERKTLEDSMRNEYEQYKKVGDRTLSGDRFYDYYYGLTEDQFRQFWTDWALVEKYNSQCEAEADTSPEQQARAYEEFRDYLYGCNATVLSLSLKDLSEEEQETKKALANELLTQIQEGTDMGVLVRKHCDDSELVRTLGEVKITPSFRYSFPEIYEFTENAAEGDIAVVESESAVYIIRCNDFEDFDDLRDTDEMIEWTRLFSVNQHISELVQSNKYAWKLNESVYNKIDLTATMQNAFTQWAEIWANEGTDDK